MLIVLVLKQSNLSFGNRLSEPSNLHRLHSAASPTALCVSEPSALRCQRVWCGCWLVGSLGWLCPSPPVEVWVLPLRVSLSPETEPEALTWLTLPVVQLRVWRAHCQRLRVVLRAVACGCLVSSCLVCPVAINRSDQTFANGCSVCDWLQPTSALGFERSESQSCRSQSRLIAGNAVAFCAHAAASPR